MSIQPPVSYDEVDLDFDPPSQSNDSNNIDSATDISIVCNARLAVSNWTSALGPVEEWPKIFREKYNEACCSTVAHTTQESIDLFLKQVVEHVRVGRSILKGVEECRSVKYPFSAGRNGDYLLAGDLMATLPRLEIHAPSGPHISDLHSSIRRHYDPLDMY